MAIIVGLLTAPTCRIFLSVARSSVHCMDSSIIHRFLIIIHGRLHYRPSMDNVHERPHYRPWETLSIINHILAQEHFLVSLGGS